LDVERMETAPVCVIMQIESQTADVGCHVGTTL
jgi:hypothetical protein